MVNDAPDTPPAAEEAVAVFDVVEDHRVDQAIAGGVRGVFDKQVVRATCPSGRALALVRKRLPDAPARAPVLLIHGWGQNRYTWHLSERSFSNFLASRGYDVFNLELTGHGRSKDFGTAPASRFEDYVEDAVAVARAVHGFSASGRLFLIGHSLGGTVCYAAAPRLAAVLGGTMTFAGLFTFGQGNPVTLRLARLARRVSGDRPVRAAFKMSFLARAVDGMLGLVDEWFWSFPLAGWYPGSVEPHLLRERLLRGLDWTGVNILLTMLRWAADGELTGESGRDYGAEFAALDAPLLVVVGDRDRMLPPEDARPAYERSRSRDRTFKLFSPDREETHWGHLDILLGRLAPRHVWPLAVEWLDARTRTPGKAPSRPAGGRPAATS